MGFTYLPSPGGGTVDFRDNIVDAFGRLRVSTPSTIFDSKQLHDNQPLFWDDQEVSGTGTSSNYDGNKASSTLAVTAATAGKRIRQTKMRFNYQPGKAIRYQEVTLTPTGFRKIEELEVGDEVFDGAGNITKVKGIADWDDRVCHRITFDDGTHVDCDEEHEWVTIVRQNSKKGQRVVKSTKQMLEEYGEEPPAYARWRIPAAPMLQFEKQDVILDPYTVGVLLGDGNIQSDGRAFLANPEKEIIADLKVDRITHINNLDGRDYHYYLPGLQKTVIALGMNGKTAEHKFVPKQYLYNSKEVRLDVLRGLMDTDGTVDKRDGCVEFNSASKQLAEDVAFLVRSLGGQAKIRVRPAGYKDSDGEFVRCLDSYRVRVILQENPFRLHRKAVYWKPRERISMDRYVHTIKPIGRHCTRCIEVESPEHTFLTRGHIVTHNSLQVMLTGTLCNQTTDLTDIITQIGYFDDNNGIFFSLEEGTLKAVLRSNVSGSPVDTKVDQVDWNTNTMTNSGGVNPSGIELDFTKVQIFWFDFEWLGSGIVRCGVIIGGDFYITHQFFNANNLTNVYMGTPNLPLRYSIESTGTSNILTSMQHICSMVSSEGGLQSLGIIREIDTGITNVAAATGGTSYALIGIRLNSSYLDSSVDILNAEVLMTSAGVFHWELLLNPTIAAGTPSWVPEANGALDAFIGDGTITVTGGTVIGGGYGSSTGSGGNAAGGSGVRIDNSIRLGSLIDGTQDIIVLAVTAQADTETFLGSLTTRELL